MPAKYMPVKDTTCSFQELRSVEYDVLPEKAFCNASTINAEVLHLSIERAQDRIRVA